MAHQSMSLIHTFENDNKAFWALTIHFMQKQIDYDYSIKFNCINFVDNACLETYCEFQ